jgi:hypothetical protein
VAGSEFPARGWRSRYYGEKEPVPSLAAIVSGPVPLVFVSILSAGKPEVWIGDGEWSVAVNDRAVRFRLADGGFRDVAAVRQSVPELSV